MKRYFIAECLVELINRVNRPIRPRLALWLTRISGLAVVIGGLWCLINAPVRVPVWSAVVGLGGILAVIVGAGLMVAGGMPSPESERQDP